MSLTGIMFSYSFCVLRHLCRRSASSSLTKAKNFHTKTALQVKTKPLHQFYEACELKRSDMVEIFKFLNNYKEPERVNWEELLKKLTDGNVQTPKEAVIMTCLKLGKIDHGMSYFKYLVEKQEDFSTAGIILFSRLLLKYTDDISRHEDEVKIFYEKIKYYLFSSTYIKTQALGAFVRFPSCFWDCVENLKGNKTAGNQAIINRAFEMDEPEIGWNFIHDSGFECNNKFLKTYMGYCTRRAVEGKFSPKLINDLVDICVKNMYIFNTNNLEFEMNQLIEALQLNQNEYTLSLEKCTLSDNNVCSNCGLKLKDTPISQSEFDKVKKHFFDAVLCNKDIYLQSSEKEVNDFKVFLENCDPYDIVFDGLNILYRGRGVGVKFYNQYLKYFLEKNFKILVIGRRHSNSMLTKGSFLKHHMYKRNFQVFLTADSTNDDLFTLYSALHGGPGTFFFSGDFLSPYSTYFTDETKILFMKWKISHQYLLHPTANMLSPWPHMGLPQLTAGPTKADKSYTWHISHLLTLTTLSRSQKINWGCLKAIPRENTT